MVPNQ